jgi:PhzF family phenazine biosynthesis protein
MLKHENDTGNTVQVHIVNAFTQDGTGGNPAGVVLDADDLDDSAMQFIAARTGLSETASTSSLRPAASPTAATPRSRPLH